MTVRTAAGVAKGVARSTDDRALALSRHRQLSCTVPSAVSVSVFSFLRSLKRGVLHRPRGFGFRFKAADGDKSSSALLPRPTSRGSHQSVVTESFSSHLDLISHQTVCVEHNIFQFNEGPVASSPGFPPGHWSGRLAPGPRVPVCLKTNR